MKDNERNMILNRVQRAGFALNEAVLFLDTHPNDCDALAYYQKAQDELKKATYEYNAKVGPLTSSAVEPANRWTWTQCPWPWEKEANY